MTSFLGYSDSTITPTQQVRLELRSRPDRYLTVAILCGLTGLKAHQVNHAIYALTKQRKIIRRIPPHLAVSNSQQAYCWDNRGWVS